MEDTLRYDPTIGDMVDAYQQGNAGRKVSYRKKVQKLVSYEPPSILDYIAIKDSRELWKAKAGEWKAEAEEWNQKYAALEEDYKAALNEIVAQKIENARKDGSIKEKDRTIGLLRKLVSDVFWGLVGQHAVNNNTTNNIGGGQTQLNGGNGLQQNGK